MNENDIKEADDLLQSLYWDVEHGAMAKGRRRLDEYNRKKLIEIRKHLIEIGHEELAVKWIAPNGDWNGPPGT